MNVPELLAPAGGMDQLKAALHFGADAVYGAMKRFGLRASAGNFSPDELEEAVRLAHRLGRRFYLTMNIFPFDDELEDFVRAAGEAREIGVDAVIASDLGAICLLRERLPELPVHVSTQASALNRAACLHYLSLGCSRVILARELSLDRIAELRKALPGELELECFVHGASCMAYSGRCLLSAALTGRSGNRGACAQPCRWDWTLTEAKRPGEALPIEEDERGTYLLSARDLCLMPLLPRLTAAGISSLKIEGRMKTEYYVATVTGAYRRALDLLKESREAFDAALPGLTVELENASHRLSDTGFLLGPPEHPAGAEGFHQKREYLARAESDAAPGEEARFLLKNRFHAGETLELMTPGGIRPLTAQPFLRTSTGERMTTLGIAGEEILMPVDTQVRKGDLVRGRVRNHRE
ncbi:MAG: U32 family peptidase [Clostridia bacterium]|nr:U32 family peptidase [Clostridia bacterium]